MIRLCCGAKLDSHHQFHFGQQIITTNVNLMTTKVARAEYLDVAAMSVQPIGKEITFNILDRMSQTGD